MSISQLLNYIYDMSQNPNTIVTIYKSEIVRNSFVANITTPKTTIPKSIRVFFLMLMGLGADFGFSALLSSRMRTIVKCYMIFFKIVGVIILASAFNILFTGFWYWSSLFTCIFNFVMLNKIKYKAYNFVKDMHDLGKGITAVEREIFGVTISVYLVTMFFSLFSSELYRCANDKQYYCEDFSVEHYGFYTFTYQSIDVVTLAQIVIYYYVYSHVKFLRNSLELDFNIDIFTKHYMALAKCCDKIRPFYNSMILINVFVSAPKMMSVIWFMLISMKLDVVWHLHVSLCMYTFYYSSQIIIPAILVQMVKCQIEDMYITLNERRMGSHNPDDKEELIQLLKYIKKRRLCHDVWGIIPTDLRLPLTISSTCLTYLSYSWNTVVSSI